MGKRFMGMLEDFGMFGLNGRWNGDREGEYTFMGSAEKSVIGIGLASYA